MSFTVAPPGAVLSPPPPASARPGLAPLGKFWRTQTRPGRWEVSKAVTADGEWLFELADGGTWSAGHLPTETVVKTGLRTLRACRRYAGDGRAAAELERIRSGTAGT